jgi:hypothetical protein
MMSITPFQESRTVHIYVYIITVLTIMLVPSHQLYPATFYIFMTCITQWDIDQQLSQVQTICMNILRCGMRQVLLPQVLFWILVKEFVIMITVILITAMMLLITLMLVCGYKTHRCK